MAEYPREREINEWTRRMRAQGVKGPLWAPDHDPATCAECQRVAQLRKQREAAPHVPNDVEVEHG